MQFPKLSQGTVIPKSLIIKELEEAKKQEELRKCKSQYKIDKKIQS